jgi:hypothetical protein
MLDQSMSSHEVAIKNLQRSLTVDEISELNELLKWVLFSNEAMDLDQLEAAMVSTPLRGFVNLPLQANHQHQVPLFRHGVSCVPEIHHQKQILRRPQARGQARLW